MAIESVGGNIAATPFERFNWTSSRGVTFSQNADGTVTASGTASAMAFAVICDNDHNTLGLVAGETYTVAVSHVSGTTDYIRAMTIAGTASGTKRYVFEVPAEGTWTVGAQISTGFTADETFRISVYKGAHPEWPATPYDTACLLATGRNVIMDPVADVVYARTKTSDSASLVIQSLPLPRLTAGTEVTISFEARASIANVPMRMYVGRYNEDAGNVVDGTSTTTAYFITTEWVRYTATVTLDYDSSVAWVMANTFSGSSGATYEVRNPMVGIGADVTYEPPASSVQPIDLDGHELRSLPDGTRDELRVDERGHVTLVQRVGVVTLDGSESVGAGSNENRIWRIAATDAYTTGAVSDNLLCDRFERTVAGNTSMADGTVKLTGTSSTAARFFYFRQTACATATEFATWLASNNVEVIYRLAEPVTIDLGWTDAIPLCGPDLTAQSVPAAPFALTYERDLNVTLARLEAALAALA